MRDDFQPRPHDDPRMDPLEYAAELAEYDEFMAQWDREAGFTVEASLQRQWLTSVSGPPEGSQARRTNERAA